MRGPSGVSSLEREPKRELKRVSPPRIGCDNVFQYEL
jgi:hypothetical protein